LVGFHYLSHSINKSSEFLHVDLLMILINFGQLKVFVWASQPKSLLQCNCCFTAHRWSLWIIGLWLVVYPQAFHSGVNLIQYPGVLINTCDLMKENFLLRMIWWEIDVPAIWFLSTFLSGLNSWGTQWRQLDLWILVYFLSLRF